MVLLSVIAILLGVGVFYWLMQFETTRSSSGVSAHSESFAQVDQRIKKNY